MKGNKTDLVLNMDEKIYLAVSKEITDKLAFVYTLACLKQDKNTNVYNMYATREIHTFKNKDLAELYHDTVQKIVEKNEQDETKQSLFSVNESLINRFMEICR